MTLKLTSDCSVLRVRKETQTLALLAALALIGMLASAPVQGAPITFNTALPVPEGEGIFRLQVKRFTSGDDPTPLGRELEVEALPLVLAWGATPRLALFAILPLLDKELTVETPGGRRRRGDSGLADVTLLARYTVWQRDAKGSTWRLAPFAGVEAPTGRDDARDALGRLPRPLQLGSGSWDPVGGLILTRQTLAWQADAAVSYQDNRQADGFELGDEARLDISYQHRLWPRRLDAARRGVPAFFYGVLESNLVWQGEHRADGASDEGSGGTVWFLAPGVQYVTRRWVAEAAVQVPVAQDLGATELERDPIVTLSARVNF